jgi:hypothetical protein
MTPDELIEAHRALWREAFSFKYSLKRIVRSFLRLRWGAFLMSTFMNGFYCWKAMWGNEPVDFNGNTVYGEIKVEVKELMYALTKVA